MVTPWTEDSIATLRALWADEVPASAIAARLGVSRSAVLGKAHRLGLPRRDTPIKKHVDPSLRRERKGVAQLPPLLAIMAADADTAVMKRKPLPSVPITPARLCCWPVGEPGAPTFRYCDAPTAPRKSYCPEHVAAAYVTVRRPGDDRATAPR